MNKYIVVSFISLGLSQIIKFIIEAIRNKRFNFNRLFNGMGGMPSSHSSFTSSLVTLVFLEYGGNSIYFAICLIFTLIILYDAIGIRYEVGLHAKVLNEMSGNLYLKDKIGHTLLEVICGAILGMLVSFTMFDLFITT